MVALTVVFLFVYIGKHTLLGNEAVMNQGLEGRGTLSVSEKQPIVPKAFSGIDSVKKLLIMSIGR